jgi:hypothetical protein
MRASNSSGFSDYSGLLYFKLTNIIGTYSLTLNSINPSSNVPISFTPDNTGKTFGNTPISANYNSGTVVSITAINNVGNTVFQKWQLNGVDYGSSNPLQITMNSNYSLTAVFAASVPQLNLSVTPTTIITLDLGGQTTYTCDVTDQNNNPVSGVTIDGTNDLEDTVRTITTGFNGSATFTTTVPNNKANGVYNINLSAKKNGYTSSASLIRQVQVNHATGITVISPSSGVSWAANSQQKVEWASSSLNESIVKILLSTDGGNNFSIVLSDNANNNGSATIVVPNYQSQNCQIKIQAFDNSAIFGISNGKFSITNLTLESAGKISEIYPDSSHVLPNQVFTQSWTIKNTGTTTWTNQYSFVYSAGQMSINHTRNYLTNTVLPGQTVTLSVAMESPSSNGIYKDQWAFINSSSDLIPIDGQDNLSAIIIVTNSQLDSLTISNLYPNGIITKDYGEIQNYQITVNDQNGNLVQNAEIIGQDELKSASFTILTNSNGIASYQSGAVPSNIPNGTKFNINFRAKKPGYYDSNILNSTIIINHPANILPLLNVNNSNFIFNASYNGTLPAQQNLIINNTGSGTLSWELDSIPSWLNISQTNGTGNSSLVSISPNISTLDPQNSPYHANLILSSPIASNSPINIQVNYNIQGNTMQLSFGTLTINANSFTDNGSNSKFASGNVNINNILNFTGKLSIDLTNHTISGSGNIYLNNISGQKTFVIYNGDYQFQILGSEGLLNLIGSASGNSAFELAGYDLTISGISILSDGIKISGILDLSKYLHTIINIDNLSITAGNGIQFIGGIAISDVQITDEFELKNLNLNYDSINKIFSGSAKIHTKIIDVDGSVTLLDGKIDTISIGADNFAPVPIVGTDISITGISGEVGGLVTPPLFFSLGGSFTSTDPLISKFVQLKNLTLSYIVPTTIQGSGVLTLFNNYALANASLSLNPNQLEFEGSADLAEILLGDANLNISFLHHQVTGSLNGSVQIPEDILPGWLDVIVSPVIHFPYTIANSNNSILNFKVSGNITFNTFWHDYQFYYIADFEPVTNGQLPILQGFTNAENLNQNLFGSLISPNYTLNKKDKFEGLGLKISGSKPNKFMKVNSSTILQDIPVNQELSQMILRLTGTIDIPQSVLINQNGYQFTKNDTLSTSSNGINYFESKDKLQSFWIISKPFQGTWQLEINNSDNPTMDVIGFKPDPLIEIISPSMDNSYDKIEWNDSAPTDSSTISLYYSKDNYGLNGILIADSIKPVGGNNSYIWEYHQNNIPAGRYYIYAIIKNNNNSFNYDYSSGRIIVLPDLNSPSNVIATANDTSVSLTWIKSNDPKVKSYSIEYWDSGLPNNISYTSTVDTNNYTFNYLTYGKNYVFGVASEDSLGNLSDYSISNSISYISSSKNNIPVIRFSNYNSLNGSASQNQDIMINAFDADNDNLLYSLTDAPSSMTINSSSGEINWSPGSGNIGTHVIKVRVSDGKGGLDSISLRLNIFPSIKPTIKLNRILYNPNYHISLIKVEDFAAVKNYLSADNIQATVYTNAKSQIINLTETSPNSGQFIGSFDLNNFNLGEGDTINVNYFNSNNELVSDFSKWTSIATSTGSLNQSTPTVYELAQNYPNPFNLTTTIQYTIPKTGNVKIKLYNILGQEIRILVNSEKNAGTYRTTFNAMGLASGIYFYRMQAGSFSQTKKLILLK